MATKQRFSKKLSWPHPLVKYSSINLQYANDYTSQLPPSTFQPFQSSQQSYHKPCPHLFRTSTYSLGSTPELNSNLQLGCIVSPFNYCNRKIPQFSKQKMIRCNNCQTLIIPEWISYKHDRIYCKLCDNIISYDRQYSIKCNSSSAVQDIILQIDQKQYIKKIIFVIQMSNSTRNSQFLEHLINNIELLRQRQNGYKIQIGFIVYAQFVQIISKTTNELQVIKIGDYSQNQLPVPMHSIMFDVESDLQDVYDLLQTLMQPNENHVRRVKFNYYQLLNMICSELQPNSDVVLIASNYKIPLPSNDPKAQSNQHDNLVRLSNQYVQKNATINVFSISKDRISLQNINKLVQKTGGSCYYYILNKQYIPQDFYYDLYQYLHQQHYQNISIKLNTSKGILITQLNNKIFQQKQDKVFTLSKLNQHSNFNVFFKLKSPIDKALLNIQIKFNHKGKTKLRVFNIEYTITNNMSDIYSSLGDQCLFYLILRKHIYSKQSNKLSSMTLTFNTVFKRILQECRNIWVSSSSFTIPNCLKYSIFYSQSIIRHISSSSDKQSLYLINQPLLYWKQGSLERLSKMISMKLFRIDKKQSISNIKYYYYNIQQDGIYAVDNGKYVYFYIGDNVSPAIVQDCLVNQSHQISMVGTRLNDFINNLREFNTSNFLQLKIIPQNNKQILLDGLFIEDSFRKFVKNLCQ